MATAAPGDKAEMRSELTPAGGNASHEPQCESEKLVCYTLHIHRLKVFSEAMLMPYCHCNIDVPDVRDRACCQ